MGARSYSVRIGADDHSLQVLSHDRAAGRLEISIDGVALCCGYRIIDSNRVRLELVDRSLVIHLNEAPGVRWVAGGGATAKVCPAPSRGRGVTDRDLPPEITPPMPAVVIEVLVEVGQRVAKGDPAVVVSAMKMESTLLAPIDGTVAEVNASQGDKVSPGDVLVRVKPDEEEP